MNYPEPTYEFPQAVDWILRQMSQFGRVPCANVCKTTPLPAALAPTATSSPITVKFNEPGIVIALYAQEALASAENLAKTEVRVQMDGIEDLFFDGQSGGGVTFPIFGLVGGAQNWFPIMRRATPGVPWLVTWKNTFAAVTSINPIAGFPFIADRFLNSMLPARR